MDEAAHPVLEGRLDQPLGPEHIHLEEVDPAPTAFDLARTMVDHVHALGGPAERGPLSDVAGDEMDPETVKLGDGLTAAGEHPDLVAFEGEPLDQMPPEESSTARDQDFHRSPPPRPTFAYPVLRPICSHTWSSTRTTSRPASPSTGAGRFSSMLL